MNMFILILGNIVETLIIYNYWIHTLERRYSLKITNIAYFSASALNIVKSYYTVDNKILRAFTTHILLITLMGVLFKDKWPRKILIYLTYFFCTFAAEMVALLLSKYLFNYDLVLDGSFASYFWELIDFLLIVLFNLLALLAIRRGKLNPGSRALQMDFLFLTTQALAAFLLLEAAYSPELTHSKAALIVAFTLVTSVLVDYLIFHYSKQLTQEAASADYLKRESELKDQHFQEMRRQYEQFRRTQHDFLNHIRVIEETMNSEKKEQYVQTLRENLEAMERTSFCNSPSLDALLFYKSREAQERGVNLRMEICDCANLTVSDYDCCTIVSNLLDNSIEAAEQTEEKDVTLHMNRKAGRLLILVENSSNPVEPDLVSTKEDKESHGIGLESIRETARKYDGDTVFRYHDGIFESVVNLEE